jgi:hypothetical protein
VVPDILKVVLCSIFRVKQSKESGCAGRQGIIVLVMGAAKGVVGGQPVWVIMLCTR